MISFTEKGSFKNLEAFLTHDRLGEIARALNVLAVKGEQALSASTPKDSSLTANSWKSKVEVSNGLYTITWSNTNVVDGVPVAILLQYGHGTGTGGYVQGRDFINPALKPIFEEISTQVWKVVTA